MKFLIFLASFLALTAALDEGFTTIRHTLKTYRLSAQEIRKYEPAFASGRIINGFPVTSDTRFPFVTDNLVTWPDQTQNICTGSILSASWTISARQCMFCDICNFAAEVVEMRAGSASRTGVRTTVFAVEAHWINSPTGQHPDFTIMRVSTPFTLSSTISPVRLPTFPQSREFFENRPAMILGWGETRDDNEDPLLLHYGDVTITDRNSCTRANIADISDYEFCARGAPGRPVSVGNGDQGGAMILLEGPTWTEFTIVGVISTTKTSSIEPNPLIMGMRIGQFWQFIHEVTGIEPRW